MKIRLKEEYGINGERVVDATVSPNGDAAFYDKSGLLWHIKKSDYVELTTKTKG